LTDANLARADLKDANLVRANLDGANLDGADLTAKILFRIDFKKFRDDLDEGMDKGTISENLRREFEDHEIHLSENATISVEEEDRRWLVSDKDNKLTYVVRKQERLNIWTEPDILETELFGIDSENFQCDLDASIISEDLRQEFENDCIDLSQNATVSGRGNEWMIKDEDEDYDQDYTVRREDRQLKIFRRTNFDPTELFSVGPKMIRSDIEEGTVSGDFHREFQNNLIDLSKDATISVDKDGWVIKDKEQKYIVRKEERLNICKRIRFDFEGIKKAKHLDRAIFDDDIWEELSGQKD
jgi:hypothetical protein